MILLLSRKLEFRTMIDMLEYLVYEIREGML